MCNTFKLIKVQISPQHMFKEKKTKTKKVKILSLYIFNNLHNMTTRYTSEKKGGSEILNIHINT